jgi:hypothetical protein
MGEIVDSAELSTHGAPMEDLVRFGEIVFGLFVTLLVVLFVTTRLHIHSLKRWMRGAQDEVQALRAELEALKGRIPAGGKPFTR